MVTAFDERFPQGSVYVEDDPDTTAAEWSQRSAQTAAVLGWEMRLGTRIDTGLIQPRLAPAGPGVLKALEIEIYVGRRFHRKPAAGVDLSAWRAALGASLRL